MAEKVYIGDKLIGTTADNVEYANSGMSGVTTAKGALDNLQTRVKAVEQSGGSGGGSSSGGDGIVTVAGNWVMLGDSITWYDKQNMQAYPTFVKQKMNFTGGYHNYAISGARTCSSNRTTDGNGQLQKMITENIVPDYVTIEFGTNDFGGGFAMGTMQQFIDNVFDNTVLSTVTFYAGMSHIINGIYDVNPLAKIIIITPRKCDGHGKSGMTEHWYDQNSISLYFQDYVDAIIEMANYMSIPVCDWWNESGSNNATMESWARASNDWIHPNEEGHKRLATLLVDTFKKVIF